MQHEIPCDVHLVNLRTMQNRDDGKDRLVPMNTAALFLHRLGYDCSFPNKGLACHSADGQVSNKLADIGYRNSFEMFFLIRIQFFWCVFIFMQV